MSQWGRRDQGNSAPIWAPATKKLAPTADNANTMYANATSGIISIEPDEINSNSTTYYTHTGWVKTTTGSGGRSGRVTHEVLVAGGSNLKGAGAVNVSISVDTANATVNTFTFKTLSVSAVSEPSVNLSYSWEYSINSTATFAAIGTANTRYSNTDKATLYIANTSGLNGFRYHVIVGTEDAPAANANLTSANATLTVNLATITINTDIANGSVASPASKTFTINATATWSVPLSYIWKQSINSTAAFTTITANATYSNVTTQALYIANSSGLNGFRYQVLVYPTDLVSAANVTSANATLTVT